MPKFRGENFAGIYVAIKQIFFLETVHDLVNYEWVRFYRRGRRNLA